MNKSARPYLAIAVSIAFLFFAALFFALAYFGVF